jgi:acetyl esterase/lipase
MTKGVRIMRTKHLVDPELQPMLEQLPPGNLSVEVLPQMRTQSRQMVEQAKSNMPAFPAIEVTERFIPGPTNAPEVRVLVYVPRQAARPVPVILWIHGGGYVVGSADVDDLQLKQMVTEVGCAAVALDYRLAPEERFPGALEDCYAALKWLHANAADLGVDANRIAIGGSSAGGGLAAALGLLARDRNEVPVAYQLLKSPMLDDRTCVTDDPHPYTGEFIWTPAANQFGWSAYLGHEPGAEGVSPYAAPSRAASLAGLPPTVITTGALDLFLDEDMEYARRMMREGVPTELHVYPGAYHGFHLTPTGWVAQACARDCNNALRRTLFPSGTPAK